MVARPTPESLNVIFWIIVLFIDYLLVAMLPIKKIIDKLYPVFSVLLVVMAVGILGDLIFEGDYVIPEINFENQYNLLVWLFIFITVVCGVISGFYATESPMIANRMNSSANMDISVGDVGMNGLQNRHDLTLGAMIAVSMPCTILGKHCFPLHLAL